MIALLVLASFRAPIQDPSPERARPSEAELQELGSTYDALVKEHAQALDDWYASSPGMKNGADDPSATFAPRFREFLDRGYDRAALWLLRNDADVEPAVQVERFARLVEQANAPWAAEIVGAAPDVMLLYDNPRFLGLIDAFVERRKGDELASELVFAFANELRSVQVIDGPDTPYRVAATYLRRYLERWPEGKRAETVGSALFAVENLRIGKVAPELAGKDVDGNELRLSSTRGKIVIVDFWGFW